MTPEQIQRFNRFLESEDGEVISFEYRKPNGLDMRESAIRVYFRKNGSEKRIHAKIKTDGKMYEKQDVSLDN